MNILTLTLKQQRSDSRTTRTSVDVPSRPCTASELEHLTDQLVAVTKQFQGGGTIGGRWKLSYQSGEWTVVCDTPAGASPWHVGPFWSEGVAAQVRDLLNALGARPTA